MKNRREMTDLKGFNRRRITGSLVFILWTIPLVWTQHPLLFAQENAVVKRAESSVVVVRFYDEEGRILHRGSGFYISREGDVITKLSPLKGIKKADLRTNDGMLYPVKDVISRDEAINLMRVSVQIPARVVRPLPVSFSLPHIGEPLLAIGGPSEVGRPLAYGVVSTLREIPGLGKVSQVTPNLHSALDGSPVVNLKGKMVGVVIAEMVVGRNVSFIIPAETIMTLLPPKKGTPLAEWEANRVEGAEKSYARGLSFLWKEEYEKALPYFLEAVKAYEQSVSLKPDFVMAHLLLGLTYIQLRDREAALKEYRALKDLHHRGYAKDLLDMIQ